METITLKTEVDDLLVARLPELTLLSGQQVKIVVETLPMRKPRNPIAGAGKGKIHYTDDWDAPIEDFKDYE